MTPSELLNLAAQHHQAGRLTEAEGLYRSALAQYPNHPDAIAGLGILAHQSGDRATALDLLRKAISLNPRAARYHLNLGTVLGEMGDLDGAVAAYLDALFLHPTYPAAMFNLGEALLRQNKLDESINTLQAARKLSPASAPVLNSLGNALMRTARLDEAITCYEQVAAAPLAASNRLFTIQYHPAYDARSIRREHELWNQRFAQPLQKDIQPHANDRSPNRRLRIGIVSTDFYGHCLTLFTTPLLRHHDREQFEIFCYADVARPDACTATFRTLADVWRPTTGIPDAALATRIREDRIDILIDIGMHMGNGRPLLFARKPAPVQIAWLAYPGTTGLSTMDARITDPYLDPPGETDEFYTEPSIRLADTFWCYDPAALQIGPIPTAGPLPADENGYITFGCLNNFCKINAGCLELWSRVLRLTNNSRLLILAPLGSPRDWVRHELARHGVEPTRVDFVPLQSRQNYLAEYHRIDIGLDSLPYNGHTTSLDSMWMGVPVVTRIGSTVVGRAGFSQLSNLRLTELAARDDGQFVKLATDLAADHPRLADLRRTLRDRMLASPLMDAVRFARSMESAYRDLWRQWLAKLK